MAQLTQELPQLNRAQLLQALTLLVGAGHVHPAQSDQAARKARPRTKALNAELMRRACSSADHNFFASPVIGARVAADRLQQLFLAAYASGQKTSEDWGKSEAEILKMQGQKITKEGKPVEGEQENLTEVVRLAKEFAEKRLPILKALGVAD